MLNYSNPQVFEPPSKLALKVALYARALWVDEAAALAELQRVEMEQENPNMLTGSWAFPTYQPSSGLMNRRASNGYSIF